MNKLTARNAINVEALIIQDDDQFLEETDIFVPPDGGYGWFVALGAFIALMWTAGTVTRFDNR